MKKKAPALARREKQFLALAAAVSVLLAVLALRETAPLRPTPPAPCWMRRRWI